MARRGLTRLRGAVSLPSIMPAVAILVAAGRGERMGSDRPKAFLDLGGQPLVLRAARAFEAAPSVEGIVVVVPEAEVWVRVLLPRIRRCLDAQPQDGHVPPSSYRSTHLYLQEFVLVA